MALLVFGAASCGQKETNYSDEHRKSVLDNVDKSDGFKLRSPKVTENESKAIEAADVSKKEEAKPTKAAPQEVTKSGALTGDKAKAFQKLSDTLTSPCNKPHSLRKSLDDKSCVSASHANTFVSELLKDDVPADEVKKFYEARYGGETKAPAKIDTTNAFVEGNKAASVTLVDYFDYNCGHCKMFTAVLAATMETHGAKVAVVHKHFPIKKDSDLAAQAAIAAGKQGKFSEMHIMLFDNQGAHKKSDLITYAKKLSLDEKQFEQDFKAAAKVVAADKKEGDKLGIQGTPTVFINGIRYKGPTHPKYLGLWIDEAADLAKK